MVTAGDFSGACRTLTAVFRLMDESGDVSDATWWWNTLFCNLDMAAIHWACDQPAYDIRNASQFPYYAVEFYHWLADSAPETEWVSAMDLVRALSKSFVTH